MCLTDPLTDDLLTIAYAARALDAPEAWHALRSMAAMPRPERASVLPAGTINHDRSHAPPTPRPAPDRSARPVMRPLAQLGQTPFAVVDLETTGFASPRGDRIIEVAVVRLSLTSSALRARRRNGHRTATREVPEPRPASRRHRLRRNRLPSPRTPSHLDSADRPRRYPGASVDWRRPRYVQARPPHQSCRRSRTRTERNRRRLPRRRIPRPCPCRPCPQSRRGGGPYRSGPDMGTLRRPSTPPPPAIPRRSASRSGGSRNSGAIR